jgi:hypothetical protein
MKPVTLTTFCPTCLEPHKTEIAPADAVTLALQWLIAATGVDVLPLIPVVSERT